MSDAPCAVVDLTRVFTPQVPGRVNIRAGGTYCVLEATISSKAEEYLLDLAVPLLAMRERTSYGTTDLEMLGLAIANRLGNAQSAHAQEILEALQGRDPKTWLARVIKP